MNWAYVHVVINHFPIVGVIIAALILIAGLLFKNEGIRISGLGTLIFSALMAVVADLTGDPAKDAVRALPDVAASLINRHEDMASIGLFIIIPAGLLAALTLYSILQKERAVRFLYIFTLVLTLMSCGAMVYVGHTGGQIRHSEFRDAASQQYIMEHQHDKTGND